MNIGESAHLQVGSNINKTNNTLITAGIPFNVVGGESYYFQYSLGIVGNAGGFAHQLVVPNGTTGNYSFQGSSQIAIGSNLSVGTRYGKAGSPIDINVNIIQGTLTAGADGVVDLQFCQHTTNASATTLAGTSGVLVTRI